MRLKASIRALERSQKRCFSKRKCIAQIALSQDNGALQKMERKQGTKLGNGQKSACDKRQN